MRTDAALKRNMDSYKIGSIDNNVNDDDVANVFFQVNNLSTFLEEIISYFCS